VLSASHGAFRDVRTSAASVVTHLKVRSPRCCRDEGGCGSNLQNVGTLGYQDAWFHVEMEHPGHDPERVLAILKGLDKVEFNEINQVFSYVVSLQKVSVKRNDGHSRQPDLKFKDEKELRNYIRTHATTLKPIYIKDIREALPPNGMAMLEALERMGEIMIMKALSGSFKEIALPPLGEKNTQGLGINDLGSSGYQRYKSLWWDDTRERGRAGKRLSQGEFILHERLCPSRRDMLEDLERFVTYPLVQSSDKQNSFLLGTRSRSSPKTMSPSCWIGVSLIGSRFSLLRRPGKTSHCSSHYVEFY
jgi:hypothetical protein